jgi:hypothetical protein
MLFKAHEDRISFITKYAKILSQKYNISINDARYFVQTYGDRAFDILKLTSSDAKYQRRIHPQFPHTVGKFTYIYIKAKFCTLLDTKWP